MKYLFPHLAAALLSALMLASCKKEICSPEHSAQIVKEGLGEAIHHRILNLPDIKFSGAVLVRKDGETLLKSSYQYERKKNACEAAIHPETSFWIASLSKQFCAASILLLAQNGQLDLDAGISDYLSGVPAAKSAITIHQLLTHTSGLSGDENDLGSKEETLDKILDADLLAAPGAEYAYSNYGYQLLAMIVESVSGKAYEDYLESSFFAPLGMDGTGNAGDQERWKKLDFAPHAKGAKRKARGNPQLWDENYSYKGSTGILTNTTDLGIWHQSLVDNIVLSEASTDLLLTRHVDTGSDTHYGYGWYVFDTENGPVFSHSGYDDFIQQGSSFRYYTEEDLLIIVLHNYGSYEDGKVPVLIRKEIEAEVFF